MWCTLVLRPVTSELCQQKLRLLILVVFSDLTDGVM